jgi:hypothetical protein
MKTTCPPDVLRLVETFDSHIESYKSGQYNETQGFAASSSTRSIRPWLLLSARKRVVS